MSLGQTIFALRDEVGKLAERQADADKRTEEIISTIDRIDQAIQQLQTVLECFPAPAPVFLKWTFDEDEGCRRARVRFGKWTAEVIDGASSVSWAITDRRDHYVDCGGGYTSFEMGLAEAEEALKHVVQDGVKASTRLKPGTEYPPMPGEKKP